MTRTTGTCHRQDIPAGRAAVSLAVVAHDDMDSEDSETVTVRIAASDAYRVGVPAWRR